MGALGANLGDGSYAVRLEIVGEREQERFAKAIARTLRATLWIARLTGLEQMLGPLFWFCRIRHDRLGLGRWGDVFTENRNRHRPPHYFHLDTNERRFVCLHDRS